MLTGLQTGLLDVVATPPVGALVLQWHTKIRYVTSLPVSYTLALMAIDNRAFDRIGESDREMFDRIMRRTYAEFDSANRDDNKAARAALEASGIDFVAPEGTVLERWRELATSAQLELRKRDLFDPSLLDETLALVEEFRRLNGPMPVGQAAN